MSSPALDAAMERLEIARRVYLRLRFSPAEMAATEKLVEALSQALANLPEHLLRRLEDRVRSRGLWN